MQRDGNGYIGSGLSLPNFHLKPAASLNNYQLTRNSVDFFLLVFTFKIIDTKKIVLITYENLNYII